MSHYPLTSIPTQRRFSANACGPNTALTQSNFTYLVQLFVVRPGRSSDVDGLVLLVENDRLALDELLRYITLDVMTGYGPVIELYILTETTFERHQRKKNPLIRNILSEEQSYG